MNEEQGKKFVAPKDLTKMYISRFKGYLDLSSLENLKSVYLGLTYGTTEIKLNQLCVNDIKQWGSNCTISFKDNLKGEYCSLNCKEIGVMESVLENYNNISLKIYTGSFDFSSIENYSCITKISANQDYNDNYSFTNIDKLINLQSMKFLEGGCISISDVSTLAHLTSVKIDGCIDSDILEKLPMQNLTELELKNSKFTNVYPLTKAENLESLDLTGGNIYERFSYQDENGENHSNVSTLQIFVDLKNKYGKLKKLYLKDCSNIQNFSVLNGTIWDDWSGFNGM